MIVLLKIVGHPHGSARESAFRGPGAVAVAATIRCMSHHATAAPRRSTEEQARLDAALTDLFERRITFNQTLGLAVESARSPEPRIRFAMRPELIGSACTAGCTAA